MTKKAALAASVVFLAAPNARAETPEFVKGPYIQDLGQTSVLVRWETTRAATGAVHVEGPGVKKVVKTDDSIPFHAVQIGGLKEKSTYTYKVVAEGATSDEGRFTTAPPTTDRAFTFLVYGDNRSDPRAHEAVVRAMQRRPAAFLVNTGDMVQEGGDDRDWNVFFKVATPMLRDRCLFAAVGNHELIGDGTPPWVRYFHPGLDKDVSKRGLFYTVRWGTSRFFFLNTVVPWETLPDKRWLEDAFEDAAKEKDLDQLFVITHHGLWSSGPHGPNADMDRVGLASMLEKAKVTLLFAGHDHLYERGEKAGVRYLLSGGGGAPLYKPRNPAHAATLAVEATHHFIEVSVDGPKASFVGHRADGSVLERCSIERGKGFVCEVALPPPPRKPDVVAPTAPPEKKKSCDCSVPGDRDGAGAACLVVAAAILVCRRRRR